MSLVLVPRRQECILASCSGLWWLEGIVKHVKEGPGGEEWEETATDYVCMLVCGPCSCLYATPIEGGKRESNPLGLEQRPHKSIPRGGCLSHVSTSTQLPPAPQ